MRHRQPNQPPEAMQIPPQSNFPIEIIRGQVVGKANHYITGKYAAPGRFIKDKVIRAYENSFNKQCRIYKGLQIAEPFTFEADIYYISKRYDLDNSVKTILDCLQYAGAIVNDNLCRHIDVRKHIDRYNPRVEFRIIPDRMPKQLSLFTDPPG